MKKIYFEIEIELKNNYTLQYTKDVQVIASVLEDDPQIEVTLLPSFGGAKISLENVDKEKSFLLQRVDLVNGQRKIYNLSIQAPIIDYGIKSNTECFYRVIIDDNGTTKYKDTENFNIELEGWILYLAQRKQDNSIINLYESVSNILYFDLNLSSGSITNNSQVSLIKNFTPYPVVRKGPSCYWSGTLKSLLGFIALNNIDYIQNAEMLKDFKNLSLSSFDKFLKDKDGNLWKIEINGAISIENNDKLANVQLKTKSMPWVETGNTNNLSLIQIVDENISEEVLQNQKSGNPLVNYVWYDEQYWDDNLIWTESEV
jgi:hypothetical protein